METQHSRPITGNGSRHDSQRRPLLIVAVGAVVTLLIVAAGAAFWGSVRSPAPSNLPPRTGALPTQPDDTPTPTSMPTVLPPETGEARVVTTPTVSVTPTVEEATVEEMTVQEPITRLQSVLPLPTVTPTPEVAPVSPRDVEISGATTLRLSLSGTGFESTGRPLSFSIDPRHYALGDDKLATEDEWCLQLGLVNQLFDLRMAVSPGSEDLNVTGTILLREGFCEKPGSDIDTVDVDLSVPADAIARIAYNLRGRRSLFGVTGLLDSDVGAIVELTVANSRAK